MSASLDPQLALDETAITDQDLEAALERHLRAKQDLQEASGVVRSAREDIDRELAKHGELTEGRVLRVGRFRLESRFVEGGHREFDTSDRHQLSIGLVDDDGAPVKRAYRPRRKDELPTPGDEALEPSTPAIIH